MMTLRELLGALQAIADTDDADLDQPVILAENPPDDDGWLMALGSYAETRMFTAGSRTGERVPYDDEDNSWDEGEGEDSMPVLVLFPQAQDG